LRKDEEEEEKRIEGLHDFAKSFVLGEGGGNAL